MRSRLRALTRLALAGTAGLLAMAGASADTINYGATSAAIVETNAATGLVSSMSNDGAPIALAAPGTAGATPAAAAIAFLGANRQTFGLQGATTGLAATRTLDAGDGRRMVRVQQIHRGLPILGAQINVQLDAGLNVLSATGKSAGALSVDTAAEVSAANAALVAIDSTARRYGVSKLRLKAGTPALVIHDPRVIGGPSQAPHAVWTVEVTGTTRDDFREVVLVDAKTSRVSVQFNDRPHAAPANAKQLVCDAKGTPNKYPCTASVDVPNPAASAVADVKKAFTFAENTYDFFARRFDRNSLDDKGLTLKSTVRWVPENCGSACEDGKYPNAFWDDTQMVYGEDFASADDVVGHELSHGFTHFTSALFYFFQSGAINESLSDIFGEFIDQSNGVDGSGGSTRWLLGEDLSIGAIRSMSDPTAFGDPDRMQSPNYTEDAFFVDQGGVHTNSGVGNKTAFLMTDTARRTFNGQTLRGIGLDKSAAIWYRVNTLYLQSGSDYADLGIALKRACADLVGKTPKTQAGIASPDGRITATDCKQVAKAVLATELAKAPLVNPIPAEAPVCVSGTPKASLFERFEGASSTWAFKPADSLHWTTFTEYAASNTRSVYATDSSSQSLTYDTRLEQRTAITVPAKSFLRFAHYYNLTTKEAGAVVEYQLAGSSTWTAFARSDYTNNPPRATLGSGSALAGKKAFTGFSAGWTSSRINLAAFAGKSMKIRFRLATGPSGAGDSWILDDIRVYRCR